MPIYKGGNALKIYKGSYKPVKWYRGANKVAGWKNETQTGESASFDGTYDDAAEVEVSGNSEQAVTVQGKNLFTIKDKVYDVTDNYPPGHAENKSAYATYDVVYGMSRNAYMDNTVVLVNLDSVNNTLTYTSSQAWYGVGIKVRVAPSTAYVRSFTGSGRCYAGFFQSNGTFISDVTTRNFTTPANCAFVFLVFCSGVAGTNTITVSNMQLELGSTATAYEPFIPDSPSPDYPSPVNSAVGNLLVNSETVAAMPILRKIGTVADTWNPATGEVVRRIGVKVLYGTEAWNADGTERMYIYMPLALQGTLSGILSSHFIYQTGLAIPIGSVRWGGARNGNLVVNYNGSSDTTAFKAYLAAQYAAGTPVTVYYQLATPTTESVAPVAIPTYPKTTIIEQDSAVKATIEATAKVADTEPA